MREIEFIKLKPGDIVYNPGHETDPWTVVVPYSRYNELLLLCGRHEVTSRGKRFWFTMSMLPDELCLNVAEHMGFRVGRIFNLLIWEKEETTP